MRWLVEIIDIVADQRFLADILSRLNVGLHQEDDKIYLTSNQFELLSTSVEVWSLAEQMRDVVSEVSNGFSGTSISFKLGTLHEQKEDGSRSSHIRRFLSGAVLQGVVFTGSLTVTPAREISEEERARLEAERLEREYQEKLALVSSRVLSAFQDERALEVHRLLQQELNGERMYKIYELIRDDLGGKLNTLASKNAWKRFTGSVNHPKVFGNGSRHAIPDGDPPSNPMYSSEAQAFISNAADLWFKQKCVDKDNA